ncbi:MAG: cytochrome P450 [Chloroflexota bacterium]
MVAGMTPLRPLARVREAPLLGSLPAMRRDMLAFLEETWRQGGDAALFHLGPLAGIVFSSPDAARAVLVDAADAFDKGPLMQRGFRTIGNNGVFILEGAAHRQERRLLAPAFQPRHLSAYAEAMVALTRQAQQGWADGAVVDVQEEMMALTMRIVGQVLFDVDLLAETEELGAAVTTVFAYLQYALTALVTFPLSVPTPRNRRLAAALAAVNRRLEAMIAERRAGDLAGRLDLLSMLRKAQDEDGARLSDRQVQDEVLQVFIAGHETTALTLAWALYLLATHPEAYEQARQESERVLGGRLPAYADLPRLPYTLQVLKETLRLYPAGYASMRRALRDVPVAGHVVRRGQLVLVSFYTLHRRPDYYPRPERFDPGRFTPEREKALPRFAYLPFGAGPHICLGNHFALMEAHLVLATLLQRVSFELVPDQRITPEAAFTMRQREGCRMVVRRHPTT